MKYILMMNAMTGNALRQFTGWPKKDIQAHIGFMTSLTKSLGESGELVSPKAWPFPMKPRSCVPARTVRPSPTACFRRPRNSLPATGLWMWRAPSRPMPSPRGHRPHPDPAERR